MDFYAPENSYTKPSDFNAAIARIYQNTGSMLNLGNDATLALEYPSDVSLDNHGIAHELNSYTNSLIPENNRVLQFWTNAYRIIFDCNTVIDRIDNPEIIFPTDKDRAMVKAEASFLRGYAYRLLGILYGGVPLVLNEVAVPKRDFVRASIGDVWKQVIADYTFAAQNLPDQLELKEDGHLTKGAAQHALAEAYIITKEWDKAIAAASAVINNPAYGLMTERFGTWKDKPGDVYSDLFRRGNVNYKGKVGINKEAIWVDQYEYLVPGGGHANSLVAFLGPLYWGLVGNDGKNLFIGPTTQMGGRGTGWLIPTEYVIDEIWNDPNDMRNSAYNIIRDVKADNPQSAYYGQYIVASGSFTSFQNLLNRWWHPIYTKTTPINDFPVEVISNPATGLTFNTANQTFNDSYYFRLAETYLLRAEAYLGDGQAGLAAADINKLRERAHATPIAASQVTINFLLDERARELCFEEKRVLTLMRLGLQKERVDKYNVMSTGNILDRNKVWPIPQSEIEKNTEAVLEQNPDY
ncbi:RagB/SusD family nutrient uptake outer membrane protein [Niabella ginsengisoli]|uniref:RagB/SusD family nutrient uptake outer membrane protein n=1 Tax=Niabella ginsengisoli TaxID=522298 RepID=A0ABS9SI68_9BACT|nr:RagB/SusD family nutrient uptake outer membrane protein [Niabella ginsengisoli]MCH5598046.1 RagB/SusD family nutrient uptake outer membrane protein [Niabella ginsengisoli]